jgi:hypothetical protein
MIKIEIAITLIHKPLMTCQLSKAEMIRNQSQTCKSISLAQRGEKKLHCNRYFKQLIKVKNTR